MGATKDHIAWYMGKRCLAIVPIGSPQTLKPDDTAVIQAFSENMVVRKMVGCALSNRVVLLEIIDDDDKNITEVNCVDITLQRSVFRKRLGEDEDKTGLNKYVKSIELSLNEETLFSVGVHVDNRDPDQPVQRGFINAMRFNAQMKETCLQMIPKTSHPEKKGMYRISRSPSQVNVNQLVVGAWTDVFVFNFADGFQMVHSFMNLHSALIYNVIGTPEGFFTCSNDCEASYIEI